jgi:hypothetical protein
VLVTVAASATSLTTAYTRDYIPRMAGPSDDDDISGMRREIADLQRRLTLAEERQQSEGRVSSAVSENAPHHHDRQRAAPIITTDSRQGANAAHQLPHDDHPMMGRVHSGRLLEAREEDFYAVREHLERMERAGAQRRVLQSPTPSIPCKDDPQGMLAAANMKCASVMPLGCKKDLHTVDPKKAPKGTLVELVCPLSCKKCKPPGPPPSPCKDDPQGMLAAANMKCASVMPLGCKKDLHTVDPKKAPKGTLVELVCPLSCKKCKPPGPPPSPPCINMAENFPYTMFFGERICANWGTTVGLSLDTSCDQRFCPDRSKAAGRAKNLCGGLAHMCNA